MNIELLSLSPPDWIPSKNRSRVDYEFQTDFGIYASALYFPKGELPSTYERFKLAEAECKAWAAQVAAASVESDEVPEVETDGS